MSSSITISQFSLSGEVEYQLQYRLTGSAGWINWGVPITGNSETVTGLHPNTLYDFQVIASSDAGSTISPTATIRTPSAEPVSNLVFGIINSSGRLQVFVKAIITLSQKLSGAAASTVFTTITANITSASSGSSFVLANADVQLLQPVHADLLGGGTLLGTTLLVASGRARSSGVAQTTTNVLRPALAIGFINAAGVATANTQRYVSAYASLAPIGAVTAVSSFRLAARGALLGAGNVIANSQVVRLQQWSSTHKFTNSSGATINLSADGLTATEAVAADDSSVYANTTATSGKYYWEVYISAADVTNISVGLGNINAGIYTAQWVGSDVNAIGWIVAQGNVDVNSVDISTSWPIIAATGAIATTVGFAVDLTNNLLWGRVGNGAWFGTTGGTPDPGTGAYGLSIPASVYGAAMSPGCTLNAVGDYCIGKFTSTNWLYAAPATFGTWDVIYNPDAPTNLTPLSVQPTSITMSFNGPTNAPGTPTTGSVTTNSAQLNWTPAS